MKLRQAFALALMTGCSGFSIHPTSTTTTTTTSLFATVADSSTSTSTTTTNTEGVPASSVFLSPETAKACVDAVGSPCYAYSKQKLVEAADDCLSFPNAFGLTVRYAMKSSPNRAILQLFHQRGIHIDASSGFEVRRAVTAGIPPENISLSTQELPSDFAELVKMGVKINACSISQLERYGAAFPNSKVGIRVNPGVGSGGFSKSTTSFSKTNVGGPSSSFGIWHEFLTDGTVPDIVSKHSLQVERIHTHIGSGSDPDIWQSVATRSLSFCSLWDTVTTLNLGGGYKVGRNAGEPSTDLQVVGRPVADAIRRFKEDHDGRELHLEIEPGTYLLAMAGAVVSTVQDKVETRGDDGHVFLKLDAGMTDVLRPSLYGAVHPLTILPGSGLSADVGKDAESVVVVGHCCESGDLMTPAPGEPEQLEERLLRRADIGDLVVMDGSGAYCSGMSTKNYNSFPEAPEVLVDNDDIYVIRERQTLEQIYQNEKSIPDNLL